MKQLLLILFTFAFSTSDAQDWDITKTSNDASKNEEIYTLNKQKRNILLISEAAAYTVALFGLNQLWYSNYPKSDFHFINDNGEWLQMDKMGHLTSSYYTGVAGIKAYQWTGMSRKNAIWYGGMTGSFFLTIIEILDGHSAEWGASAGDLIANTSGSLLAIGQALKWNEQRIQLKYSYSPSHWANLNVEQLGKNHLQRFLKDYNAQTYWMSFNLKSLLKIKNKGFPSWISLAFGYSGDKMIEPYPLHEIEDNSDLERERQFLLSFDIDLNRIKTKNKVLNSVLHTFGFLKFPTPALELRSRNLYFHSIYY